MDNRYVDIMEVIEKEVRYWMSRYGEPPQYAFLKPSTLNTIVFEQSLSAGIRRGEMRGFHKIVLHTSFGQLELLSDDLIEHVNFAYVGDSRESTYLDYVADKIILEGSYE